MAGISQAYAGSRLGCASEPRPDRMLHFALYYARRAPIFPIKPVDKRPLTQHGFQDATQDRQVIAAWWCKWPNANVGIPTGAASGILVLDVDPRHDGNESLSSLEAKHGALPSTLESYTGGGGRHLFFALSAAEVIRNSAGKLGPGLDVRGEGGYVVIPPSIHPQTKQPYRWVNGLKAAPVPAWLLRLLSSPAPAYGPALKSQIPAGQRNDTLARLAGAMRRKGFTQEAIEAALLAENAKRCNPPLPESEVGSIARSISRYSAGPAESEPFTMVSKAETQTNHEKMPAFPAAAWRGIFSDYRALMPKATEASDAFHFATLWARCAVALGRRIWFDYGMKLFPNVYLVCFGATGDRKSTATRKVAEIGSEIRIVRGGGSGEGIADEFSGATHGEGLLLYAEEFSHILRPGRWEGATLIPFLTQCFDCPARYEMKFRKSPIGLDEPTPSLLAGTTPDWFWQDFRAKDFAGGFGNRLFFFTGQRKNPIPLPASPDLSAISSKVDSLASVLRCQAQLEPKARDLWEDFYRAWAAEDKRREPLLLQAIQRIPAYVLKLAMLYAAAEGTLPEIAFEQLAAAILVGRYGESCAAELLSLQNAGSNPRRELERQILAFVARQNGRTATKRSILRALQRHYTDTDMFNRSFDALARAGEIFTKSMSRGSVLVGLDPLG